MITAMLQTPDLRSAIRAATYAEETALVRGLAGNTGLDREARRAVVARGAKLVRQVREHSSPTMMEAFLAE